MFPRAFRPAIHHPRRPRASPLWQLVHHAWDDFLATYETHRRAMGSLHPGVMPRIRGWRLRLKNLPSS